MMLVELAVSRLPGGSLKWELLSVLCEFDGNIDPEKTSCQILCSLSVLKLERLHCTRLRRPHLWQLSSYYWMKEQK